MAHHIEKKPGWREGAKKQDLYLLERPSTKLQESPLLTYLLTYLNQTKTTQETKQNGHRLLLTSKYRENTQERKQNKIGTWQKKDCSRSECPARQISSSTFSSKCLSLSSTFLSCLLAEELSPTSTVLFLSLALSLALSVALPLLLLQFPNSFIKK